MGEAMTASIDVDALAADLEAIGWRRMSALDLTMVSDSTEYFIYVDPQCDGITIEQWRIGLARLRPIEITHPIWMTATEIIRKHTTAAMGREEQP